MAVLLQENMDADYEPSDQEICEYGEWLGMDLETDQDLLWIAREGLKAPLPGAWKPCQSSDGDIFYFNFETHDSVWDHPSDELYRSMYRRMQAKRDAPVRAVTISGSCEEGSLRVVVCGSLTGEQLLLLHLHLKCKVRTLRATLALNLQVSRRRLRILLADATLLTEQRDREHLASILGISCAADTAAQASQDEQRQQKMRMKAGGTGTESSVTNSTRGRVAATTPEVSNGEPQQEFPPELRKCRPSSKQLQQKATDMASQVVQKSCCNRRTRRSLEIVPHRRDDVEQSSENISPTQHLYEPEEASSGLSSFASESSDEQDNKSDSIH
jgi:hypothetical protein